MTAMRNFIDCDNACTWNGLSNAFGLVNADEWETNDKRDAFSKNLVALENY